MADIVDATQARLEKEEQEVLRRARMDVGISPFRCDKCGEELSEARRRAVPGTRLCVPCQEESENERP